MKKLMDFYLIEFDGEYCVMILVYVFHVDIWTVNKFGQIYGEKWKERFHVPRL